MPHNNDSLPTQKQSHQLSKPSLCIQQYGNKAEFYNIFTPANIDSYSKSPSRCVNGSAPSLNVSADAYGEPPLIQWISTLLVRLSEYMGARQKMTPYQMERLARNIYTEYGYLKVTELMLFVSYAERGKLGTLDYGSFDPVRIMQLLSEFNTTYRAGLIESYQQQRQEQERKLHDAKAIPCPPHIKEKLDRLNDKFKL